MEGSPSDYPLLMAIARDGRLAGDNAAVDIEDLRDRGYISGRGNRWELSDRGWRILWTYTQLLEKDPVLHELALLRGYAVASREAAETSDAIDLARAYLGG